MKTLNKFSIPLMGFLQATAFFIYVLFVALIIDAVGSQHLIFAPPLGFALFLILFTMSAVISATIVLGKVGYLFWEKRYKESFTLLFHTIGWSFFYFLMLMLIGVFSK